MAGNSSTSPELGKIYSLRQSVQKAISLINHYYEYSSFTIPSVPSSSSSNFSATTNTKHDNPKPRPCIYWDFNDGSYTVLLITYFDRRNPIGPSNDRQSMESNIPKQSLLKYLVSIDPTPPTPGRRAIAIERSPNTKFPKHPNNMFLILIPIKVELDVKWAQSGDAISSNDLLYISDLLAELDKDRKQKIISNSSSTPLDIPSTRNLQNSFIQMHHNNSEEDNRNSITSDSSDCAFMFQEHIDTCTQVIEWLKYDFENVDDF